MLYIFGDSHANNNFYNIDIENVNLYQNSITMYRIGRDGVIINFDSSYNSENNTFILLYGEVDCRCHIGKRVELGIEYENVCEEIVNNYIETIKKNIIKYKQIIICSITPPYCRYDYESINGPITHEFPFIGSDEERVKYTILVNKLLKEKCIKNNFTFLDIFEFYSGENGTLKSELSDKVCHIIDNEYIIQELKKIFFNFCLPL